MPSNANPLISMIPIAVIFVIFYVLIIRPQQKQVKEHQKMLEDLKKGDKVLTNGGIYGTIMGFKGSDIELKIAENVKVIAARSSISRVVGVGSSESTPHSVTASAA